MHDATLALQGESWRSANCCPAPAYAGKLERITREAREALCAMDEILWAINPRRTRCTSLPPLCAATLKHSSEATPIQCMLDVEPGMSTVAFDLPFRRNLLLAVKEALNNTIKHSEATELLLQIRRRGRGLTVVVQDNGKGFDQAQAKTERNGLDNMTEPMTDSWWSLSGDEPAGQRLSGRTAHSLYPNAPAFLVVGAVAGPKDANSPDTINNYDQATQIKSTRQKCPAKAPLKLPRPST